MNNSPEQSIAPPSQSPEIPLGFVDLLDDKDKIVRRYLLSRSENPISEASPCTTKYSFGWQLAYQYLNAKKIPVTTFKDDWKFGAFVLKHLGKYSGGYQNLDARGNQLLINYRHTPDPIHIAQQVTLRDIWNADSDRFNPAWVKNRVVLIGVVAPSIKDPHQTPEGEMRSLYIHAHVVSQLLSTVEDHRPLYGGYQNGVKLYGYFAGHGTVCTSINPICPNTIKQYRIANINIDIADISLPISASKDLKTVTASDRAVKLILPPLPLALDSTALEIKLPVPVKVTASVALMSISPALLSTAP